MLIVARPTPNRGTYANQWEFALSAFPADRVVDLNTPTDVQRIVLAPPDGRYVQGVESLDTLQHPSDATYVFGPDWAHLTPEDIRDGDRLVYIPTATHHEMYSWVAYSVVMWDRRMKRG